MTDIIVIKQDKEAALVQWADNGMPKRAIIPADAIMPDGVDLDILLQGIPFGVDWDAIIQANVTPNDICAALRKNDIWTFEDVRKKPSSVVAALQAAYKIDLSSILELEVKNG